MDYYGFEDTLLTHLAMPGMRPCDGSSALWRSLTYDFPYGNSQVRLRQVLG